MNQVVTNVNLHAKTTTYINTDPTVVASFKYNPKPDHGTPNAPVLAYIKQSRQTSQHLAIVLESNFFHE